MKTCPIHHRPLVTYCPACRGAVGGKILSAAKRKAILQNLKKARKSKTS